MYDIMHAFGSSRIKTPISSAEDELVWSSVGVALADV